MYYAHKGSSSDNAFTTHDNAPKRIFLAFETKKERQQAQDNIWSESNYEQNLIFCDRKMVEKFFGKDFIVVKNVIYNRNDPR